MAKGKDECWCKWKMKKGICLLVIGVLVWLNEMYSWTSLGKLIAIIAGVLGIIMILKAAFCKCRK